MTSRASQSLGARPLADSRAPRLRHSHASFFFAGECLLKLNGGGARGNANPHRSRFCFCPLCGRPVAWEIHPSASASGLFPLWLRRPRFLGRAFSSQSRLLAAARGASCLGGGRNPPPSSSSSSFLRIPLSHNPLPRFQNRGTGNGTRALSCRARFH